MSLEQSPWFQLGSYTLNAVFLTLLFSQIGVNWADSVAGCFLFAFSSAGLQKVISATAEILLALFAPLPSKRR